MVRLVSFLEERFTLVQGSSNIIVRDFLDLMLLLGSGTNWEQVQTVLQETETVAGAALMTMST